jgi:hypothetical protein
MGNIYRQDSLQLHELLDRAIESSTLSSATKFFDNAPDAEVDEAADCNPAYRVRVSDGAPNGRDEQLVAPWSRKPAHRKGIGVRIPSLPPIQRRIGPVARHRTANAANADEAHAGSIPASSAKWVGGRVRLMAFACRAKSPLRDALVRIQPYPPRPSSPTGRGSGLKIRSVWVRIPGGPPPLILEQSPWFRDGSAC